MSRRDVPPGHVLIRIEDLAALLENRPRANPSYMATWRGLAAATGLLTSELGEWKTSRAEVAEDVPAENIAGALMHVATAMLRRCPADEAEEWLQHLGAIAAYRGEAPRKPKG